ncbi:MAG: hypothetical protein RQ982_05950 [Gammaproteobacteria bacterium]|nr:hypothetical protein [Gammaproteobacteria bacterium]
MMKRLFYFTGYRLSVLHYRGKELVGSSSFEPTVTGMDQFRSYLVQTPNISGKFLVDVIEEDFRKEIVPHVGSKDRKAVISRLVDRYYRASKNYFYSEVLGREKEGRRDDVVLLGAMTNPQLIEPWISIIEDCEVPLSGIWTMPLVSKKILKILKASVGVVLLVSQQVNSNVRQTLFRDCKLMSSRQSIINQDIDDISAIGELAEPEVKRTINFLRGQNLIVPDEVINLHILGSDEQLQSLQKAFVSNVKQTVTIHRIADINKKLGLKGVGEKFSDEIFAWLCLSQGFTTSHYGERKLFVHYYNRLAAAALYVCSLLILITSVLITESNISDAIEYEKSITLLNKEENEYKDLYSKKFEDFEDVFQNAGLMNSAVDLASRIKLNSATSPLDFMLTLSKILDQKSIGDLYIDKIEWQAVNTGEKTNKVVDANFTADLPVKHHAIVTGRILESEYNYRASIEQIHAIISFLKANPRIETVQALKMPVDLRSESKFATESGVDVQKQGSINSSGVFSLEIIMKEPIMKKPIRKESGSA